MALAEEMRTLTQDIASSFDTRAARVKALKRETAVKLKAFRQEMKDVQHELRRKAADLKKFLSNAEAYRMRDFRAMHQGIRARQEERNGTVARMLESFRRQREAAASHWQSMTAALAKKRVSLAR